MRPGRFDATGNGVKGKIKIKNHVGAELATDVIPLMKIKVIKRNDDGTKPPPTNRKANSRPKKPRSMESTVQDWITERRENDDAEHRSRNSQLANWTDTPTEAA